jgi:ligand-binding sensor domain-containing protein
MLIAAMPLRVGRLALCAASVVLPALAQRYSFRHYGQDEGLSNLSIESLFQDRTGFLWVGSQNGLFRYDGARFVRFGVSESLKGSSVVALAETRDGIIWASALDGLAQSAGDRFESVPLPGGAEPSGRGSLAVDPSSDALYVSTTLGVGVLRRGGVRRVFEFLPGTSRQRAWSVQVEKPGVVWFGCENRVCRFADQSVEVYGPERGVPQDRWEAILIDREGAVWIRSARDLRVKRKNSNRFAAPDPPPFTTAGVAALAMDHRGWVYSPTDFGLQYWTGAEWRRITANQGSVERFRSGRHRRP